jgi:predicted alpha/beta hydrolase family esterase
MHITLNLIEIFLLALALVVGASFLMRRYEIGNREGGEPASAREAALGIAGEFVALVASVVLYPLGYLIGGNPRGGLRPGETPVILCHGFMHNRSGFLLMRYRLGKAGWHNVIAPNFRPSSSLVPEFAQQLAQTVHQALAQTGCDRAVVVGHSMGGVVVRYFADTLGGAASVCAAVTLGAPHRGTKTAVFGLFESAKQFRIDSALVASLDETPPTAPEVMTAVWSDFDSVILPPENAMLPAPCRNVKVRGVGHVALLFSGQVFEELRRVLADVTRG